MSTYTFLDLQTRYNMKKSAIHKFLVRHLAEINKTGRHALKTKNKWFFDDAAIAVMDRLRGYGQIAPEDTQTIAALQEIIENLRQELIASQKETLARNEEVSALKDQLIAEMRDKAKIKDQLATVSFELLQIQDKGSLKQLSQENKKLEDKLKSTQTLAEQLGKTVERLEDENDDLERKLRKRTEMIHKSTTRKTKRPQPARVRITAIK